MKITMGEGKERLIQAGDMKIGEVGDIQGKDYSGLLLRTYSGWVHLNNPESTWSVPSLGKSGPNFKVRVLKRGESFTVTIE
jgi:hypothetical protein